MMTVIWLLEKNCSTAEKEKIKENFEEMSCNVQHRSRYPNFSN